MYRGMLKMSVNAKLLKIVKKEKEGKIWYLLEQCFFTGIDTNVRHSETRVSA
jgi:hypothetical protein